MKYEHVLCNWTLVTSLTMVQWMVEDCQRTSVHGGIVSSASYRESHINSVTHDLDLWYVGSYSISTLNFLTVELKVILNPSDKRPWRSFIIHRTLITSVTVVLFHCSWPLEMINIWWRKVQQSHKDTATRMSIGKTAEPPTVFLISIVLVAYSYYHCVVNFESLSLGVYTFFKRI